MVHKPRGATVVYIAKKHDPEFEKVVKEHMVLDHETGNIKLNGIYASLHVTVSWKGSGLQIPYSHIVWLLTYGKWPAPGAHLDHKNDDPFDNRPSNLEETTEEKNQFKRRGRIVSRNYGKNSKYGYGMGIFHDQRDGRYYVSRDLSRGHGNGELKTPRKGLGGFDTLEEAEAQVKIFIEQIKEHGLDWMPESVGTRLSKKTIRLRQMTPQIRQWREEGKTLAEIKKLTGFSEGTLSKITTDMGVDKRTEKQVGNKLTPEDVVLIRQAYADGFTLAALGRQYNVSAEMIGDIVHRKAWKHVE
jgi:hypothetical protein